MSRVRLSELIAPSFFGAHADVREGRHAEYWLTGGRGSCKSSFASIEIALGLLEDERANAIVYRKVASTLRESVYAQMLWALERLGVADGFRAKLSPMEIECVSTGQKILFRGADDPGKSKSLKLAKGYFRYLWFEELTEFSGMDDLRSIKASVIRGGRSTTFFSYNPPASPRSWVNAEARMGRSDRFTHHSDYRSVPEGWLGASFLEEAERLRERDERAWRHMYLGEQTGTGASVFENLSVRAISEAEISGFGACYMGLDFGWFPDPLHWVKCAYHPASKRLWVFDEYRAWRQTNFEAYCALRESGRLEGGEEVIADSAERKSVADMRAYGLRCVGASKGPGSVRASIKWLQGLSEIVIDPARCPYAAREFLEYEYERTRDGEIVAGYPDRDNHGIDAVRYALNRVWTAAGT